MRVEAITVWCSTPFGITEGGMGRFGSLKCSPSCAQRLSASQRGAWPAMRRRSSGSRVLNAFRHHRGGHKSFKDALERHRLVLNAFRHHRGGHWAAGAGRIANRGVLNAFRHHRGGHERPCCVGAGPMGCAQRLSASQRGACSGRISCTNPSTVLNAFRHHRGGHVVGLEYDENYIWSATPFGITEGGMAMSPRRICDCGWCSTPFGITEGGIMSSWPGSSSWWCAQRLSASQRGAFDVS